MIWFRCMLENVMAACHSILVPARILEHPNKVPTVHGGYNTYHCGRSQHYTHRDNDAELPSNSLFRSLTDCFDRNQRIRAVSQPGNEFSL